MAAVECSSLLILQNHIKCDADGYLDDFLQQHTHFMSAMELFRLQPSDRASTFTDQLMFIAHVIQCYPKHLENFPQLLVDLLLSYKTVMHSNVRLALCKALLLLRTKKFVTPLKVIEVFFELIECQDKVLRKFINEQVIAIIKRMNKLSCNVSENTAIQNFLFKHLSMSISSVAKISIDCLIACYKSNVWRSEKVVNMIAKGGLFSKSTKVLVAALSFFVSRNDMGEIINENDVHSDSDDDSPKMDHQRIKEMMMANRVSKKSRKKARKLKEAKKLLNKEKKKQKAPSYNFTALHLLHDPQDLAEKLLRKLQSCNERFEVKLMMLDLTSRLIGLNQLIVINFYPFIQRYLNPNQRDVTKVLLFAAQASHDLVPPDVIGPMMRVIADNFVTERNADEVLAVGLNAIREICSRCPFALSEELLGDLVQYKAYRNKAVVTAARSLIQLFRENNPELLHKKLRGRPVEYDSEIKPKEFAELQSTGVSGAEILYNEDNESKECLSSDNSDIDSEEIDEVCSDEEELDSGEDVNCPDPEISKQDMAMSVLTTRILDDEDFRKIKLEQYRKKLSFSRKRKRRNDSEEIDEDDLDDSESDRELPAYESIARVNIKRRHDKEARLASILSGREDRDKFAKTKKRMNEFASTTNKEKAKKKNFMMVRHKMRISKKTNRSFRDRQLALRKTLQRKYNLK